MRIVCLSAESADICFRLGAWEHVVAVSAFCPRHSPRKPIVSGFSTANLDRIVNLNADLVLTFSDVQAEIAAALIRRGQRVFALNHYTLTGVGETITLLGQLLDRTTQAAALVESFIGQLESLRWEPRRRPRIYFEEWDAPLIFGVPWVSEIITLAGGEDIFSQLSSTQARNREVAPEEVAARNPEIILASWCGKPVDRAAIRQRPAFAQTAAIKRDQIYHLEGDDILQAGPALLRGASLIRTIVQNWVDSL
jgi:iron complex transport system substrate-binding protein